MSKSMSCIESMCPADSSILIPQLLGHPAATEAGQGQRKICPATGGQYASKQVFGQYR